jgi:hypothetical protein
MRFHKHYAQLMRVRDALVKRSEAGLRTRLAKVPGHAGCHGNERADKAATTAHKDADPMFTDSSPTDNRNQYFWVAGKGGAPTNDTLGDIKAAVAMAAPAGLADTSGVYATAWQAQYNTLDLQASTRCNRPGGCSHQERSNMMRAWWGMLWNNKLAKRYRKSPTDACPLCKQPDSCGHILGGCMHKQMKAAYISRHNKAVQTIYKAITMGNNGRYCMVMDAGPADKLPPGTTSRLPRWTLPATTRTQLTKMRPDIAIIEGVTPEQARHRRTRPSTPAKRAAHTIHLIEVGYTSDTRHAEKLLDKQAQHATLTSALMAAGWKVKIYAVTLGNAGTIHSTLSTHLTNLGATRDDTADTIRTLHKHAVHTAYSINTLRQSLTSKPP